MSICTDVSDREPQAPTLRVITTAPTPSMGTPSSPIDDPKPDDESDWDDVGEDYDEEADDEPKEGWINEPPEPPQPPDNEKGERAYSPFIVNADLD